MLRGPILLLHFFLLYWCEASSQKPFEIFGNLKGAYTGKIFLSYGATKDSAVLDAKGNFHFRGEVDDSLQGALFLGGTSTVGWIYLEPSNINVQVSSEEIIDGGKPINDLNIDTIRGSASEAFRRVILDSLRLIQASNNIDSVKQQQTYHLVRPFVESHPRHRLSAFFAGNRSLTFDQINSLYQLLDSSLLKTEEASIIVRLLEQKRSIQIGSKFIEIRMPDSSGHFISTKMLDQNLLLVEFWASWCGPCIAQIPDIKALHNKYQSHGFKILGVSLDVDGQRWKDAMKRLDMGWPNVSELNGWDSKTVKQLSIFSIPFNILVKGGIVVAVNLSPESLEKKLPELLSAKQ